MKDIKQVIETIKNPQLSKESSRTLPSKEIIEHLWAALTGMYGGSFTREFGEHPDITGTWRSSLYGKSEQEIKNGLANLADSKKDYPPNAVQFRAMCTKTRKSEFVDPIHRLYKPEQILTNGTWEERKENARKHMDNIWTMLGNKK